MGTLGRSAIASVRAHSAVPGLSLFSETVWGESKEGEHWDAKSDASDEIQLAAMILVWTLKGCITAQLR